MDIETKKIKTLAREKNAIILSHYYQESDIQDIADFIGDSLELARKATSTDADIIVFCGVYFMAEVAKILNPSKKVLIPDLSAGCSLADACSANAFKHFRAKHPDHIAITYINCSAEVKALSDIICTSSNAEKIINQIPDSQKILFAPDKYLGSYLIKKTGRDMLLWQGSCMVHEAFSEKALIKLKIEHPDAHIVAHPECPESLLSYAHFIGSTSKLLQYTSQYPNSTFIVLTESGIIHQMKKVSTNSKFYTVGSDESCASCATCQYMRLNTVQKVYDALNTELPEIKLDENMAHLAKRSLDRMMKMS